MAYCRNCGTEVNENDIKCPACGAMQQPDTLNYTPAPIQEDNGGCLWNIIGFFVPIVGLILWLVWRTEKPKTAKAVGIGALISACISVGIYVLIFALSIFGFLFAFI